MNKILFFSANVSAFVTFLMNENQSIGKVQCKQFFMWCFLCTIVFHVKTDIKLLPCSYCSIPENYASYIQKLDAEIS